MIDFLDAGWKWKYVLLSLLNLAKSFSFLIYSGKTFHIFGAAAVNDLSPKSAFELSGRVMQNNAHITQQVTARTSLIFMRLLKYIGPRLWIALKKITPIV